MLATRLISQGFHRSKTNDSLFLGANSAPPVHLLVHVDDTLVFGERANIEVVKKNLSGLFSVTDLAACRYFSSMKIQPSSKKIFLSQRGFAAKIFKLAGMLTEKPTNAPSHCCTHPTRRRKHSPRRTFGDKGRPMPASSRINVFLAIHMRLELSPATSMLGKYHRPQWLLKDNGSSDHVSRLHAVIWTLLSSLPGVVARRLIGYRLVTKSPHAQNAISIPRHCGVEVQWSGPATAGTDSSIDY